VGPLSPDDQWCHFKPWALMGSTPMRDEMPSNLPAHLQAALPRVYSLFALWNSCLWISSHDV
jgi:hypothetical protein